MDDRDEPNRIEIELTSHEPVHGGTPRSEPPLTQDVPGHGAVTVGEPVRSDDRNRRLVLGVSAIAVAALFVGVAVGRMGRRGTPETDDATAADDTAVAVTSAAPTVDDRDTLPAAEPVPPTTPPSPTTTEAAGWSAEELIDVHPSVDAEGVEILALTNRGQVVRVDPASGNTVTADVQGSQFGPPALYAGDGWTMLPSFDPGRESVVLHDDGSRSSIALGSSWLVLADTSTGRVWSGVESADGGAPVRLVETAIDGGPTGAEIELNGVIPRMLDPLGGVLVDAPGGSYVLTPEEATRLTAGRVLALGRQRAFVQECDEALVCTHAVIDRSSGEHRVVPLDPELGEAPNLESSAWWVFQEPWNESEDALLVLAWNPIGAGRQSYGVLDVEDGDYIEIGNAIDVPSVRWVDDRSLLWLDRGRLRWFDLTTGESVLLTEDLGTLNAFTTRPSPAG